MSQTITATGMSWEHCEKTDEEALEDIDGVTPATADHDAETAMNEGTPEPDALTTAVEKAGYDASP